MILIVIYVAPLKPLVTEFKNLIDSVGAKGLHMAIIIDWIWFFHMDFKSQTLKLMTYVFRTINLYFFLLTFLVQQLLHLQWFA